jgi:hypothetical protein
MRGKTVSSKTPVKKLNPSAIKPMQQSNHFFDSNKQKLQASLLLKTLLEFNLH